MLDTNILIDAERSAYDLNELIDDDDEAAVAAISVAELGVGVEITSGKRQHRRRAFLDDVIATLPVLGYDLGVARRHTALLVVVRKSGRPRGAHDLIIAATALATSRTVVTADMSDFADLPGLELRQAR